MGRQDQRPCVYDLRLQVKARAGAEYGLAYRGEGEAGGGAGEYLFQGKTIRHQYSKNETFAGLLTG